MQKKLLFEGERIDMTPTNPKTHFQKCLQQAEFLWAKL